MGALIALASRVVAPLGRLGARLLPGRGTALALGAGATAGFAPEILGGLGDVLDPFLPGGGGRAPRRRRRKALTNDDVRTALTIASAVSKKAAENFILMRVRGQ